MPCSVPRDGVVLFCIFAATAILIVTAITAACSPPNSADAMAYHMPRVVYWAEQGSVRFFSTPYLNQIMLQPLAEYFMLHTYVLSGGDRLVNFVPWGASLVCVIAVSAIASLLGAGPRGQAIAALFCASLPAGVLAASSAKNDYLLAMWMVAAIYFAFRFSRLQSWSYSLAMGAAAGLALLTKATAYLFLSWLLAAALAPGLRKFSRGSLAPLAAACAFAALLNTPHWVRNYELSGNILGYDSAQGDGFFRWRNESFGWRETASNILRHVSDQLGARSDSWNRAVYDRVVAAHRRIGISVNDPATTWRWTSFEPPRNANHEANANSKWELAILAAAAMILIWRVRAGASSLPVLYLLALVAGFITFCAYLKWQPFEARLFLPLLVASSPLAGLALDRGKNAKAGLVRTTVQIALCLFLLTNARRPAFENWVRPLKGERSVLRMSRDGQYFSDMSQWNNRPTYEKTVELLAAGDCRTIGIDATNLSLEYPLMALLRERRPDALFVHAGVSNSSSRFGAPVAGTPCTIVCMNCVDDPARVRLYGAYPIRSNVDKFVVFERSATTSSP